MYVSRVSNPKSEGMQNEFSVFSSRSTLGKIETTPQIGEALERVGANAILNHERKYKKGYVTKIMHMKTFSRISLICSVVSIFPRVDLTENTEMKWFCILPLFGWTP